jgi:hypothetical protein
MWKPIPGYENLYAVSDRGKVKRIADGQGTWKGLILAQWLVGTKKQYFGVQLRKAEKSTSFYVHTLVALAFIGPRPSDKVVNHKDGNRWNNRPSNLEYITVAENRSHSLAHHLDARVKLDREKAAQIRNLRGVVRQVDAAKEFGVSQTLISRIQLRKLWK